MKQKSKIILEKKMSKIQTIHTPGKLENIAINGALDFWQERVGNTNTINTASSSAYVSDMVQFNAIGPSTKNFSMVRSTDVPTQTQSGFNAPYSTLFTMITGLPSPAAGDLIEHFLYKMEGNDYRRIHGKIATFGFWIKASIAGTYSFSIRNAANNRSYVTTFNVSGANSWQFQSVTVSMDSQGTWVFDNNLSMLVSIASTSGATYSTSTLNAWQSGLFVCASSGTNFTGTSGATCRISMFSITEGSLGFGPKGFQRAGGTIQQELALCQRYYEKSYAAEVAPASTGQTGDGVKLLAQTANDFYDLGKIRFAVNKRAVPSVQTYNAQSGTSGQLYNFSVGSAQGNAGIANNSWYGFFIFCNNASMTANQFFMQHWSADARL